VNNGEASMLTMHIFPSFIYYIALYNFIIALTFPKLYTYTHEMHIFLKYIYTYPIGISKIIFTLFVFMCIASFAEIFKSTIATFDVWMSKSTHGIFGLVINFINTNWSFNTCD
jgi:hypothetical protein